MTFACSELEQKVLDAVAIVAHELRMQSYVVGGFVRDKLLGRDTKDIDIVCQGNGIELATQTAARLSPGIEVHIFKNFGTAHFIIDGLDVEFVGARKESYRSDSRKPTVDAGTIEDDQRRRDLTINALAVSLNKDNYGELIDPFGGIDDLHNKILRTPLAPQQTFSDDPLRMLRTIRFACQLHYTIHPITYDAICSQAHRIEIISRERIADELHKIMLCSKPSIGLNLLFQTGLLAHFFPALVALAGTDYIDGQGHKDNFYHTIQVVDNIAQETDKLWLRWAALLHDIGKPLTKKFEEGHGWTFHGHEIVGAKMIPNIFKSLRLPTHETMRFVQKIVALHHRLISLTKENITDSAVRRLLFDAGDDIDDLMTLCRADITSKNKEKVARFKENLRVVAERLVWVEEHDKIRNWQPPITGEIIMRTFGLQPSKPVGIIKDAVREAILDGIIPNDYDAAYAYMTERAKELGIYPV
jgi:uncharacterized domain HDIG